MTPLRPRARSIWSFSLRSLLILTTLAAVLSGTFGRRALYVRSQRDAANSLVEEFNATIEWQYHPGLLSLMMGYEPPPNQSPPPAMSRWLGKHFFGNVVGVSLPYNRQIDDADLALVGEFKNLQHLNLNLTAITDTGLRNLSDLHQLQTLKLASTEITDEGLIHLHRMPELKVLDLGFTHCGDPALNWLAATCPGLERIDLTSTRISDDGLDRLLACKNLTYLNLTHTAVTSRGVARLSDSENLITLVLQNTAIDDEALAAVSKIPKLQQLNLRDTPITDAGLERLASAPNLNALLVCGTQVTDAGLKHLGRIASLRTIDLRGLPLTDEGLMSLKSLPLDTLLIHNTNVMLNGLCAFAGLDDDSPSAREQIARVTRVLNQIADDPHINDMITVLSNYSDPSQKPLRLPKLSLDVNESLIDGL